MSLGIVTRGRHAEALTRTLRTIIGQDLTDWEVVVLDEGGGCDAARAVADLGDERVRHLRLDSSARRSGSTEPLGQLLAATRGDYVGLVTDQQLLYPDHLDRLTALLEAHPRAVAAHATYDVTLATGGVRRVTLHPAPRPTVLSSAAVARRAAADRAELWLGAALLRRHQLPVLTDLPDGAGAAHRAFWLRMAGAGTVAVEPVATLHVRRSSSGVTEPDVLAIEDGSYRPTVSTVRAYQAAVRGFGRSGDLPLAQRAGVRLRARMTVHHQLRAVVRRRWSEEAMSELPQAAGNDRLVVLRAAVAADPTFATNPITWACFGPGAWSALCAARRDGGDAEGSVIELRSAQHHQRRTPSMRAVSTGWPDRLAGGHKVG